MSEACDQLRGAAPSAVEAAQIKLRGHIDELLASMDEVPAEDDPVKHDGDEGQGNIQF